MDRPDLPSIGERPLLTHAARPATYTVEARDETGAVVPTPIAGEHPLTVYVDKKELVTIMTLGSDTALARKKRV